MEPARRTGPSSGRGCASGCVDIFGHPDIRDFNDDHYHVSPIGGMLHVADTSVGDVMRFAGRCVSKTLRGMARVVDYIVSCPEQQIHDLSNSESQVQELAAELREQIIMSEESEKQHRRMHRVTIQGDRPV